MREGGLRPGQISAGRGQVAGIVLGDPLVNRAGSQDAAVAVLESLSRSWDEAEHPRDRRGRFAEISAPDLPDAVVRSAERAVDALSVALPGLLPDRVEVEEIGSEDTATARSLPSGGVSVSPESSEDTNAGAIVHELAHSWDRQNGEDADTWWSSSQAGQGLIEALRQTPTAQRIRNGEIDLLTPQEAGQMSQGRELFARAVEQYIAEHGGDEAIRQGVESRLISPYLGFQFWPEDEFAPIAAMLRQMFGNS
jgi:hypothetical protein